MISKHDVMAKCSDLMLEGEYNDAIEALKLAQKKGCKVTEEEVKDLYELKVAINYELCV